jgi:hypothetical protein
MTNTEMIADLGHILEQEVMRDLKLLTAKVDNLSIQIEASRRATEEKLDAIYVEQIALGAELKSLREDETGSSAPALLVH